MGCPHTHILVMVQRFWPITGSSCRPTPIPPPAPPDHPQGAGTPLGRQPSLAHGFSGFLWEHRGNFSHCHIRLGLAGLGSPTMPSGRGECQLCGGSRRHSPGPACSGSADMYTHRVWKGTGYPRKGSPKLRVKANCVYTLSSIVAGFLFCFV